MLSISDILATERGPLRADFAARFEKMYSSVYSQALRLIGAFGFTEGPELLVVSSPSALPEMRRSRDEYILVYDQYLGQIFSRIDALIAQEGTLDDIDAYLCKLYSGRLLYQGRTRDAFVASLVHFQLRSKNEFVATPDVRRFEHVAKQEAFVIAHELCHWALAINPWFKEFAYDLYFELCKAEESDLTSRPEYSMRSYAEALADDYNREYIRRHGPVVSDDMLRDGREILINRYLESIAEGDPIPDSETVRKDPRLAEEVVCDAVALVLTVQIFSDQPSSSSLECVIAAFDAIQKLRLIKYMDAMAVEGNGEQVQLEATIRGKQIRQFLRALYESGFAEIVFNASVDESDYRAMLNSIRTVNVRFYNMVFDQLLTGSFFERFSQTVPDLDEVSLLEKRDTVFLILGFSSDVS